MALHVRGVVLPDDQERDLYIAGDRITLERLTGAETVVDGGWLVPGLVDVHTHPGAEEPGDPPDEELLRQHGIQHADAGVTLLRVPGSAARLPAWFGHDDQLPRVYGAGPWLAAPGGYFPGWGRRVEVAALPQVAVEEAQASGGWCKLISDWGSGRAPSSAMSQRCHPRCWPRSSGGPCGWRAGGRAQHPRRQRRGRDGGRRRFAGARHAPGHRAAGHHGPVGDCAGPDHAGDCPHPRGACQDEPPARGAGRAPASTARRCS